MTAYNLVSFAGIFVLAAVAWLFSSNRKVVNARVLFWGIGLQLLGGLVNGPLVPTRIKESPG